MGPPAARNRRRRGARGKGRAQGAPTMPKLSGTQWPQSAPAAEPGLLARRGPKGGGRSPQMAGRGRRCATRARGQHPRARYSPRAGAARHSQSASSAHSRAGCRAGIFSVASSSAAAAWADPHGEGVPTEEPPLSPVLLPLRWRPASRWPRSSGWMPPLPAPRVSRARDAASAAARSSALTFSSVQSRVSFRLGRLLPPQTPPPVAQAGPPPAAPRGFPQEEAPAEPRAEGSTTSPQPRLPARPGPRRVPTRLNAFGAGAPRRARPLPTAVGVRTLNFRR